MTNKQRAKAKLGPRNPIAGWISDKTGLSQGPLLVVGLVVAVVIVGLLAVVTSRGSDSASDDTAAQGTVGTDGTSSVAENQPVEVVGEPLPSVRDFTDDPAVGMAAPVLEGFDFDGTPVTIDPADGPVMVVFLAHWCPHCNAEIPRLNSWKTAGGIPAELRIIGVSTAVAPGQDNYPPSQWLARMAWEWPVLADSVDQAAAQAYGVSGYPYFAIVGDDGLVKVRTSGELGIEQINDLVDQALAS